MIVYITFVSDEGDDDDDSIHIYSEDDDDGDEKCQRRRQHWQSRCGVDANTALSQRHCSFVYLFYFCFLFRYHLNATTMKKDNNDD